MEGWEISGSDGLGDNTYLFSAQDSLSVRNWQDTADLLVIENGGDVTVGGGLTVSGGGIFLTPVASSGSTTEGTVYYDSDNDKLFVYTNGAFRALTTGLSAYSATDAALANQNYLEILHNEATNDLAITAWYFD